MRFDPKDDALWQAEAMLHEICVRTYALAIRDLETRSIKVTAREVSEMERLIDRIRAVRRGEEIR